MKNYIIISLLFLSLGFSQKEYNYNYIIEMNNGLWTEKFSEKPITGRVYIKFGEKGKETIHNYSYPKEDHKKFEPKKHSWFKDKLLDELDEDNK